MAAIDYEVKLTGSATWHAMPCESEDFSEVIQTLGSTVRTAAGRLVSDVIAQKHQFSFHWEAIGYASGDNSLGGLGIENFRSLYESQSDLSIRIPRRNNTQSTYTVRMIQGPFEQAPSLREQNDNWYGSLTLVFAEI